MREDEGGAREPEQTVGLHLQVVPRGAQGLLYYPYYTIIDINNVVYGERMR